jgi:hypothetical protein
LTAPHFQLEREQRTNSERFQDSLEEILQTTFAAALHLERARGLLGDQPPTVPIGEALDTLRLAQVELLELLHTFRSD